MAGDNEDESQKTEEPTHRRLEEALKRGQVVTSREVVSFFMIVTLAFTLAVLAPVAMEMTVTRFASFVTQPHIYFTDEGSLRRMGWGWVLYAGVILLILIGGTVLAAIAGNMIQHPIVFSVEPIKPKLEKVSPIKGWKRIFSRRSVMELIKGIIKIIVVGAAAYWVLWPYKGFVHQLPGYPINESLSFMAATAGRMMLAMCVVMAFIAALDYLYQRFEFMKQMRMSRQELREEFKQQEGDPHIKAKVKAIRMERARKRMMAAVPEADVVITNPTHFAVALRYDRATMEAPMLVAKGADKVAERIRQIALDNEVPLVENPPLARALFATVELDQQIPVEHYQAVAEIIGYVYRLRGKLK